MSGDSADLITFQFHALVTIDEQGLPCGEASTDLSAALPDGHLHHGFDYVSGDGYGLAQVAFEVKIPKSSMWYGRQVLSAQLIDKPFIAPAALPEPNPPAIINANEIEESEPEADDSGWDDLNNLDDDDFEKI